MASVDELFARHQREGRVTIVYDTHVYYAQWPRGAGCQSCGGLSNPPTAGGEPSARQP